MNPTTHDHPYHDLLHRMDLAMLGSCTCVTKTPDIAFHDEKCRYRVLSEASAQLAGMPRILASQRDIGRQQYAQEVTALWTDYKAKAEAYDAMLRDFAFRYGAGGYNSDGLIDPDVARDKLEWIVSDAITHAKAALAVGRTTLQPCESEDGKIVCWYFDCEGVYIDVEKDDNGHFSVYFRDRDTGKEAWLDQAERSAAQLAEEWKAKAEVAEQQHDHWKANHDQMVERLRLFTQRPDLPVDRIAAHTALAKYQDTSKALGAALTMALQRIVDMLQEDDGQAFKEAKRALPTMWSVMALATGTLPEWDAGFIHRIWSESWDEALRDAGVGIGNVDTAHINQPIVFARKLFATVFSPSPAREQYAASMVLEREKLKTWMRSLKADQEGSA